MWQNSLETKDMVTLTEEILDGKLHFLWSECTWLVSVDSLTFYNFSDYYYFGCHVEV